MPIFMRFHLLSASHPAFQYNPGRSQVFYAATHDHVTRSAPPLSQQQQHLTLTPEKLRNSSCGTPSDYPD